MHSLLAVELRYKSEMLIMPFHVIAVFSSSSLFLGKALIISSEEEK